MEKTSPPSDATVRDLKFQKTPAAVIIAAATAISISVTTATGLLAGPEVYLSIAREYPGRGMVAGVAILRSIHEVFSILTLGLLATVLMFDSRDRSLGRSTVSRTARSLLQICSAIWASAVLSLVVVDGLNTNGLSLPALEVPQQLWFAMTATPYSAAWLIVFAAAFLIFVISLLSESWTAHVAALWFGLIAILAPVVIAQVLVGPNHDLGVDAAVIQTPVSAFVLGLLAAGVLLESMHSRSRVLHRLVRSRLLWIGVFFIIASDVVITVFKLSGSGLTESTTGWQIVARWVAFVGVCIASGAVASKHGGRWARTTLVVGIATWAAVTASMALVPSPNYFVPNDPVAAVLGYVVEEAPDAIVLLTNWRVNLLFSVLAVTAIVAYAYGVLRLKRRGDVWPVSRTISWLIGWSILLILLNSGLGKYSPADFGIHMVVHMTLNMLIPAFLVVGGPITLMLRALAGTGAAGKRIHRRVNQLLHSRGARFMMHPLFVFTVYIASYYVLYLTPLFSGLIRYHWGHQLMNVHFLIVGYMFFSLVVGVDRVPFQLPQIGKLGYVLAAMPFHAFFGIVLMMSSTPVALNFYRTLDLDWLDIEAQQYFGGGIAWAGGELPLLGVVVVLGIQWARQDKQEAKRFDRHEDAGLSDEFTAYNAMLQRLATRDGKVTATGKSSEEEVTNREK